MGDQQTLLTGRPSTLVPTGTDSEVADRLGIRISSPIYRILPDSETAPLDTIDKPLPGHRRRGEVGSHHRPGRYPVHCILMASPHWDRLGIVAIEWTGPPCGSSAYHYNPPPDTTTEWRPLAFVVPGSQAISSGRRHGPSRLRSLTFMGLNMTPLEP